MDSLPAQGEMTRSSSFARSLYQAASASGEEAGVVENQAPGGMRRQRSRRRMSGRDSGNRPSEGGDASMLAAAAAAVQFDEGDPTAQQQHQKLPPVDREDVMPPPPSGARQSSWYSDALLQSGAEDLTAILGQVQMSESAAEQARSDDDEVLEQYRIMAHVEANIRVKDNTGFDMVEYERKRKMQPEPTKEEYYAGSQKPKPILPEPRLVSQGARGGGGSGAVIQLEEPPLPPPRANNRFIEQRSPRVPELCTGAVVRGHIQVPNGEHLVRCFGCRAQLRVNLLASLVSCPDCSTVSPATSIRR